MARIAVIRFPGSNCEAETVRAIERAGGLPFEIWHRETSLHGADAVILPGGFSYGDYLRCGAIARFSPVMPAVLAHARDGGPIVGICNGFQILCEAGLLPGAVVRNVDLHFVSRPVALRVERGDTVCTTAFTPGEILHVPVGHGEGRYVAAPDVLDELEAEGRVVFRYVDGGYLDTPANPNGAERDIAAISDPTGRIVGMMPHPERVADPALDGQTGLRVFSSLIHTLAAVAA